MLPNKYYQPATSLYNFIDYAKQKVKKMCLKVDIRIAIKNNTTGASYQRMLTKFIDLIFNFSIDNTKFVIKCQAEFL